MEKHKTRVSFWATKVTPYILDKRVKKVYNKLLEIEVEIEKLRNKLFDEFSKPHKVKFYTRPKKKKK